MARTPKARALGAALRQAREQTGMLLRELGAAINRDAGVLSRWETGERTPKPEQVAQILTTLGVGGERYDELMTLAYRTDESQWVATTLPEQAQQMAAYIDWERTASRIVEVAPLLVPGLLQTNDYISAIMTAGGVPEDEVSARITSRIGRRDVITRLAGPADLVVLLGQAALNQWVGGADVMAEQLRHLVVMAARPNVELRIVPDRVGWHPGLEGAFTLIDASRTLTAPRGSREAVMERSSIAFVETRRSVLMLHENHDVASYRQAMERTMAVALPPDASARLVEGAYWRLERKGDARGDVAQVEP